MSDKPENPSELPSGMGGTIPVDSFLRLRTITEIWQEIAPTLPTAGGGVLEKQRREALIREMGIAPTIIA